jgi:H+-translocating NAD(P) transhydrogenase subunit beta
MSVNISAQAAYLVAALLSIAALAGLSHHQTARAGNSSGIAGMAVALAATIALAARDHISGAGLALLIGATAVGAAIGLYRARVVEITGMPELLALLHSFVGLAAVLVGWNGFLRVEDTPGEGLPARWPPTRCSSATLKTGSTTSCAHSSAKPAPRPAQDPDQAAC